MKAKLSKKLIIIVNIIVIVIFISGLIVENFFEDNYKWVGILCQIISLLYTVIFGILGIINLEKTNQYPTEYFTDRQLTLNMVISSLYQIICNNSKEQIISILCDGYKGTGKTELLLKLHQLLLHPIEAKKYFSDDIYYKYKKVKNKLGYVRMVDYLDDRTISIVNNFSYVIFKKNVVLIDGLPLLQINKFSSKFIIIYCKQVEKIKDDIAQIQMKPFSHDDIKNMFYSKFEDDIEEDLLKNIINYSNGNVSKIASIFKSKDTLDNFKKNEIILYPICDKINIGNYIEARRLLNGLTENEKVLLQNSYEHNYRLFFIKCDLLHFENRYHDALVEFELLLNSNINNDDHLIEIIDKISHINKHLGNFEQAINELSHLDEKIQNPKKISLYLLAYAMLENQEYFRMADELIVEMSKNTEIYVTKTKDSYHTYKAVICCYCYQYGAAHKAIDIAIACYENISSRFLTNCYFIKGEIFRHENRYAEACLYYQKCINTYRLNDDFDVYSLAFALILYVKTVYNINHEFEESFSIDQVKSKCSDLSMKYNLKIVMNLDELLKSKNENRLDEYEIIHSYFERYIFFIP